MKRADVGKPRGATQATLRIELLGQARFSLRDVPLPFRAPPRTLPLLGYLLLNRKAAVKREQLAALLWPDQDEEQSRANLRRHLYHLQHALNPNDELPPLIVADGTAVQWNAAVPLQLDVEQFEGLSRSPATLNEAVASYTGDLLGGVYDEWVFPARERLRLLYIADLSALALESRSRRDFKAALTYVQRVLQADPWREDAIRQAMILRFEIGDRAGALAEYLDFARRLQREMDLEPMPETVAVYELVRHNATALSADAQQPAREKRAETVVLPLTGREEVVATLKARWAQAARGHGNTVLLGGEAGIGKSRIAAELALLAEAEGARVLTGATTAVESSPYDPIAQALRASLPLFSQLKLEPLWKAALAALLPELRTDRSAAALPALEPGREQLRLFEAVAQLLFALAKTRPVLLLIEDIHLAGAATAKLLAYLGRRTSSAHLLVVVTYRCEEATRAHPIRELRRLLEGEELAKHIALGPLSRDAVARIARASRVPELAEQLYAQSEGNPFFLTEMLRSHFEGAGLSGAGTNGIQSWISKRTAGLSAPARSLVEVASVIGPSFDVELLREVCEWDEATLLDTLDEMLDRQLIRESAATSWDFAFSHHLIHTAIYEQAAADTKKRRHRRVARALCELFPERLDELAAHVAVHLERAGEGTAATPYYLRAARSAQALFANVEAVEMATRGLTVCAEPATRTALSLLLESLYARLGDRKAQAEVLAALERHIALDDAVGVRTEALLRRVALHHYLGEREHESAALRELDALCVNAPEAARAERMMAQARYHKAIGDTEPAIAAARQALSLQSSEAAPAANVASLCMLAELYSGGARYEEAAGALSEAQQLADRGADTLLLARVLRAAVKLAMDERNFTAARDAGERLLALCERIGDRKGTADAHAGLGAAIGRAFEVALAAAHYQAAAELYRSLGEQQGEAIVSLNGGTLRLLTGDCAAALRAYATASTLFGLLQDVRGELLCALNASLCALYLGDCSGAAANARIALPLARRLASRSLEAHALSNLGAAERDAGDCAAAIAHMTEGIAIRRTLNEGADLASDLCDLGLAYLQRRDLEGARRVLDDLALVGPRDVEAMLFPQYFNWVKSALLDAAQAHDEARAAMAAAHAEFQRRLAAIPDKRARPLYRSLPFNEAIERAYEATRLA